MESIPIFIVLTVLGVVCGQEYAGGVGHNVLAGLGHRHYLVNVVPLARFPLDPIAQGHSVHWTLRFVRTGGKPLSHLENVVHDASTHQVQSLVNVHRDAAVLVDLCILNATEITLVPEVKNAAVPVVDADALDLCLWEIIADKVKVKLQASGTISQMKSK
ncbi:hypothetical protein MAR_032415 [Mya arenaria]|uniref:Secreted protein n=1 Tax=Mya arenaria TaxID=6604 RepID=A0ABY7FA02_MYAAR|nr:hypothetical protein MAR_032415 [Mya arenaria]